MGQGLQVLHKSARLFPENYRTFGETDEGVPDPARSHAAPK